jgi:uncharacterized protein YidB (DUF937 family)
MMFMIAQKMFGILAAAAIAGTGAATAAASTTASVPNAASNQQAVAKHDQYKHNENWKEMASILGIDVKTLQADLKSGKSLAEIAQTKGISEQTLISDLQAHLKTRLDQAVANGKMTADKENEILSKSASRFKNLVEHKGLFKHKKADNGLLKDVSSILGIDVKTLRNDLKSGESIAEVAQSKNISEQTLISDLQAKLKARLDQAVAKGKLTADKESQILSKSASKLQKFVEHKHTKQQEQQEQQEKQEQNS